MYNCGSRPRPNIQRDLSQKKMCLYYLYIFFNYYTFIITIQIILLIKKFLSNSNLLACIHDTQA